MRCIYHQACMHIRSYTVSDHMTKCISGHYISQRQTEITTTILPIIYRHIWRTVWHNKMTEADIERSGIRSLKSLTAVLLLSFDARVTQVHRPRITMLFSFQFRFSYASHILSTSTGTNATVLLDSISSICGTVVCASCIHETKKLPITFYYVYYSDVFWYWITYNIINI